MTRRHATAAIALAFARPASGEPKSAFNPESGRQGMPMLFTRLNDTGSAFEPQRNVMLRSFGLDGGGSVAADRAGNVYVTWHGIGRNDAGGDAKGEARRQVWVTKSEDDGASFIEEKKAWERPTGACGCCGMKTFASRQGTIYALYRSATESVHRDMYMLTSADKGRTFEGNLLHKWEINACPMSSMDLAENGKSVIGAWETGGQVYWAPVSGKAVAAPNAAPGDGKGRKHPRIAVNNEGDLLLVWTENTGWQRGGSLAWQLYGRSGKPTPENGQLPGVPAWSFAAPSANADGNFSIIY